MTVILARRQALRQMQHKRVARVETVPPPIGGWNTRDALALMPAEDAPVLDNWFPATNEVRLRNGFEEYIATGIGSTSVGTLVEYNALGVRDFMAGANGHIYEVTTTTPVSKGSGFSENRWQTLNYAELLWFFNGVDTPQKWDGSTLAVTGFTGPTVTDLVQAIAFKNRILIVEKDSASFWYPATIKAVTGALTEFDVKGISRRGGTIVALGAITNDGGDGVDDKLCIFLSSGAVLIYQGTDPGSDFALVGEFDVGELLSRRGIVQFGSDLVAMTRDGFTPLTRILPLGRAADQVAFTDKISGSVSQAVKDHEARDGWEVLSYPRGPMLVFNIPQASGFVQYVMNSRTGAWCRFTGIAATTWGMFNNDLYFGTADGKIFKADTGQDDDGVAIATDGQQAFSLLGSPGVNKRFVAARPIMQSGAELSIGTSLSVDYDIKAGVSAPTVLASDAPVWDVAIWDVAAFGQTISVTKWVTVTGTGFSAGLRIGIETSGQDVSWQGSQLAFEPLQGSFL